MFRIFRTRFKNLKEALDETGRVQLVSKYLSPYHVAGSDEFLVTYIRKGRAHTILCGLQEYVNGEILDPWRPLDHRILAELLSRRSPTEKPHRAEAIEKRVMKVKDQVRSFVENVKKMISEAAHVPDLAGIGNLLVTHDGLLKLVDINNISPVAFSAVIYRDDRGYPVCDKSIEALSLLEGNVLGRPVPGKDVIYEIFLEPSRMQTVRKLV